MPKEKYIEKQCRKHGLTEFVLEGRGYYRCCKCRSEKVANRRRTIKEMAIQYKGGKCRLCGYSRCPAALEFHHLYGKDFGIAQGGNTYSWDRIKKELDKCELLCANCHREVHTGSSPV